MQSLQQQVTQIYQEARDDVYYYALTFGIDPAQAQDVAQETFLRLYIALRNGEEIRNPRAWIFRAAHNLGLRTRARQQRVQPLDSVAGDAIPQPGTPADALLIEAERRSNLADAIAALSPQQRQCLHLRAEGLRYREIAAAIGISVSTVSEFLTRAIAKLKGAVNE